jgi:hypothetical protein
MTGTGQTREAVSDDAPAGLPVLPPVAALLEIAALIILPGLLDYLVPGFPTLNETQPHYYWLPVLLLTLQYGSPSGLLAAGVAIVISSFLGWPEQEIGENHFSYLLRIWLQPVLWIATAVVLGQFRLRQIEAKQALERSVALLGRQRAELAEHAQRLRERCDRLERVIATRHDADAPALMAALGRTQATATADREKALHDSIALAFGKCRLTMLTLIDGELRSTLRHGAEGEGTPHRIAAESPFVQAVVGRREALSVLTPSGEQLLDGHGLAAVPVVAGGSAIGVLLLEACSPDLLDTAVPDRLAAIAMAIAAGHQLPGPSAAGHKSREVSLAASEAVPVEPSRFPSWRRVRRRLHQFSIGSSRSGRRG